MVTTRKLAWATAPLSCGALQLRCCSVLGRCSVPAHLDVGCPSSAKRSGSARSTRGGAAGSRAFQMRQVPSKLEDSRASAQKAGAAEGDNQTLLFLWQ